MKKQPTDVLVLFTRNQLLAIADRLGVKVLNRRPKDALISALVEAGGGPVAVASLDDERVRRFAAKLGLLEVPTGEVASLRERLVVLATSPDPTAAAPPDVARPGSNATSPHAVAAGLEWKTGGDSPNGRRVLDVQPGVTSLLSMAQDPRAAFNVMAAEAPNEAGLDAAVPEPHVAFDVHWPFDADDLARIERGFKPSAMEDKWRIVTRVAGTVTRSCFLRSWTNNLFYVLVIRNAIGVRLLAQSGDDDPVATARAILDGYLLNRVCVLPGPPRLGTDPFLLLSYALSVAGRRCDYVEPAPPDARPAPRAHASGPPA